MIALPEGVTVHAGGREWTGEIPEDLCPDSLKPAAPAVKGKVQPAVPAEEAR